MADDTALLRSILEELRGIHALLHRVDRRQMTLAERAEADAAEVEIRQSLASRLERAHRVKPRGVAD